MTPGQRANIERINDFTDGVAEQINQHPEANRLSEQVRQRCLGAMYMAANVKGEARTADDIRALISAGVDFFVGQLQNQYRQVMQYKLCWINCAKSFAWSKYGDDKLC